WDSTDQIWAGGSGGQCATNGGLAEVQQEVHLGNHGGYFTWKITDMERKWNINTLLTPGRDVLLKNAFVLMGGDASQVDPLVNSILDWIDPDDLPRMQGAETETYQTFNPPYEAKNGPMDDINELLFVRGITPDMYLDDS